MAALLSPCFAVNLGEGLTQTYDKPSVLDLFKIALFSSLDTLPPQGHPFLALEKETLAYLDKVSGCMENGTLGVFNLPIQVVTDSGIVANFPDKLHNVQNYSSDIPHGTVLTNNLDLQDIFYKTLKSIGVTPTKLFNKLMISFKLLGVNFDVKDVASYLRQSFHLNIHLSLNIHGGEGLDLGLMEESPQMIVSAMRTAERSKPGERFMSKNLVFSISTPEDHVLFDVNDLQQPNNLARKIVKALYYQKYKGWFNDQSFIPIDGIPIYVNHHTAYATMLMPKDFKVHPAKHCEGVLQAEAIRVRAATSNSGYPDNFKSFIPPAVGKWRQLLTEMDLTNEGKIMRHCIGGPRYQKDLVNGGQIYFHLEVSDRASGATLSMVKWKPSGSALKPQVFRMKGVPEDSDELWTVDQYYGYRDESLRSDALAMATRNAFLNTVFDELHPDVIETMQKAHRKERGFVSALGRRSGLTPGALHYGATLPDLRYMNNEFDARLIGNGTWRNRLGVIFGVDIRQLDLTGDGLYQEPGNGRILRVVGEGFVVPPPPSELNVLTTTMVHLDRNIYFSREYGGIYVAEGDGVSLTLSHLLTNDPDELFNATNSSFAQSTYMHRLDNGVLFDPVSREIYMENSDGILRQPYPEQPYDPRVVEFNHYGGVAIDAEPILNPLTQWNVNTETTECFARRVLDATLSGGEIEDHYHVHGLREFEMVMEGLDNVADALTSARIALETNGVTPETEIDEGDDIGSLVRIR